MYRDANFARCQALSGRIEGAEPRTRGKVQELTPLRLLIKIGAKVVRHARKVIFQMAEVAVPRELFREILRAIERLRTARAVSGMSQQDFRTAEKPVRHGGGVFPTRLKRQSWGQNHLAHGPIDPKTTIKSLQIHPNPLEP